MIKKILLSLLLLTIVTIPSISAQAGNKGGTETVNIVEYSFSLFPRHFYTIELFNNPQISESQFTMRFASYGIVSGCASMYGGSLETKETFDTIKLTISDAEVTINDDDPRYTNYDCEITKNRSFFDVKLDRDELIKKKTKHIELKSESYGNFVKFDIDVSKEKITLFIKNQNSTFIETLWFLPKNAVILHVPNAKAGLDIQSQIKKFGKAQGLNLMEDIYKGFELPYDANNYALFTDSTGGIVSRLFGIDENIKVGNITVSRTIYDANGAKEEDYDLDVYAALTGKKSLEAKDKFDKYDKYLLLE